MQYTLENLNVPDHWWENENHLSNCLECGRPTNNPTALVEIWYGGGEVRPATEGEYLDWERDGGYMGKYPIGSECAKKFEAGMLITGERVTAYLNEWADYCHRPDWKVA
jgi:hypothetical protein